MELKEPGGGDSSRCSLIYQVSFPLLEIETTVLSLQMYSELLMRSQLERDLQRGEHFANRCKILLLKFHPPPPRTLSGLPHSPSHQRDVSLGPLRLSHPKAREPEQLPTPPITDEELLPRVLAPQHFQPAPGIRQADS